MLYMPYHASHVVHALSCRFMSFMLFTARVRGAPPHQQLRGGGVARASHAAASSGSVAKGYLTALRTSLRIAFRMCVSILKMTIRKNKKIIQQMLYTKN